MFQDHDSWNVAVIDGNEYTFSSDYLKAGRIGGQLSATTLSQYLRGPVDQRQLYVTVYLNRVGVSDSLIGNGVISQYSEFEDFVSGFNQVSPLLTIIDVGAGIETTKTKVEGKYSDVLRPSHDLTYFQSRQKQFECFLASLKLENCILAVRDLPLVPPGLATEGNVHQGGHDSKYTELCASLQTNSVFHKLELLTGCGPPSEETKALRLVSTDIPGLFMDNPLPARRRPEPQPGLSSSSAPRPQVPQVSSASSATPTTTATGKPALWNKFSVDGITSQHHRQIIPGLVSAILGTVVCFDAHLLLAHEKSCVQLPSAVCLPL